VENKAAKESLLTKEEVSFVIYLSENAPDGVKPGKYWIKI